MWEQFEQLWYSDDNVEEFASNIINSGKKVFKYNPDNIDRRTMRDLEREANEMRVVGVTNVITGFAMLAASFITTSIVLKARDAAREKHNWL